AGAVERQQLEVVLENHGDVARPLVVDRTEALQEEARHAHTFVAIAAEGPGTIVLAEEHAAADVGMCGTSFDLGAEQERSIERRGGDGHRESSLAGRGRGPL